MRRTARLLTGTALAVAAAGFVAAPAHADDTGGLEVFPSSAVPGGEATVNTAACGDGGTAAGDASAVGAGSFTLAPSTHEGDAIGQFRVPSSAQPGTYEIVAKCAEGGKEVSGDLVVTLTAERGQVPRGSVKTGVGGVMGPDPVQTAAGVAALAVAAAGGTWLLHRRARGDGI
ncbi:hypothetical protein ABZ848_45855 [Streptomyces sp. NPDC047081]|uniref:hypothetical protein n=1 Tax=Streptomyces sp. NPDC047081 TaxID=3154706 RepID=UPI003402D329